MDRGGRPAELTLGSGEVGTQTSVCFKLPRTNPVALPAMPRALAYGMTLSPILRRFETLGASVTSTVRWTATIMTRGRCLPRAVAGGQ